MEIDRVASTEKRRPLARAAEKEKSSREEYAVYGVELSGQKRSMGERYGDGSGHDACPSCGYCITCGDCLSFGCGTSKASPSAT